MQPILIGRVVVAVMVIAVLGTASWCRSAIYKDEKSLWLDALAKSPDKARPHNNYGKELKNEHRLAEAQREFERALELEPELVDAINNLATIYASTGRRSEALALLRTAVKFYSEYLSGHYNLAMNLYVIGLLDEAANEYNVIIRLAPESNEAYFARQMLKIIEEKQLEATKH